MALTIKEVEHVAMLARLNLSEQEKETFAKQLSSVLNYADKLKQIDTENVKPLDHILPVFNVFRKDIERESPSRDEMLSNAPLTEEGQYKVPRIM